MNKVIRIAMASAIVLLMGAIGLRAEADDSLPEGLRGFSGQVLGVVVEEGRENSFAFKVVRVLRVRKNNEAEAPKALAGRTVRVGPSWVSGEDGKWRHAELHSAFINGLRKGQKFALDIWSCERGVFAILRLSEKQRRWAEQEKKKQEKGG